jgi:hypothetical protein
MPSVAKEEKRNTEKLGFGAGDLVVYPTHGETQRPFACQAHHVEPSRAGI